MVSDHVIVLLVFKEILVLPWLTRFVPFRLFIKVPLKYGALQVEHSLNMILILTLYVVHDDHIDCLSVLDLHVEYPVEPREQRIRLLIEIFCEFL